MRKVVIASVGVTKFTGKQPRTAIELFGDAATEAINECGIKPGQVQSLFMGNFMGDFEEG